MALVVLPFLCILPEPERAGSDHRLARARDTLDSGKLLTFFRQLLKPTLVFQVVTEEGIIAVFDVVEGDRESRPGWGDITVGQRFPARVVQQFHRRW